MPFGVIRDGRQSRDAVRVIASKSFIRKNFNGRSLFINLICS